MFKKLLILLLIYLTQACTSGVEVAANLGKKYLIPKDKEKIIAKPIYKVGNKYNIKGKYYLELIIHNSHTFQIL